MIGKKVKITGSETIPERFKGQYGIITGLAYGDKWIVLLEPATRQRGSLSHTARMCDFEVVEKL